MKEGGICIAIFGGIMILMTVGKLNSPQPNLSSTTIMQESIGGICGGLLLVALGMKMANKKQPNDPNKNSGQGSNGPPGDPPQMKT